VEFRRRRKVESLVSIAPLIDCVFLLLIFFLLTSSFIEQAGIEI
jgi:biopolymer transport protein ExbD